MHAEIAVLVAVIVSTGDGIRRAGVGRVDAAEHRIAQLRTIAEQSVLTRCVVERLLAGIGGFVAGLDGACDSIRRARGRAGDADSHRDVARFRAVAVEAVVALTVGQAGDATIVWFVATLWQGARVWSVLTTERAIADFLAVAEVSVLAK